MKDLNELVKELNIFHFYHVLKSDNRFESDAKSLHLLHLKQLHKRLERQ